MHGAAWVAGHRISEHQENLKRPVEIFISARSSFTRFSQPDTILPGRYSPRSYVTGMMVAGFDRAAPAPHHAGIRLFSFVDRQISTERRPAAHKPGTRTFQRLIRSVDTARCHAC